MLPSVDWRSCLFIATKSVTTRRAQALANALLQCGLEELHLDSNQIGDSGAQALANALPQCGLERLDLGLQQIE